MNLPDYLLLDAARMKRQFNVFLEKEAAHACLYNPRDSHDLASVAPYLANASTGNELLSWFWANGLGDAWGIGVHSPAAFDAVLAHFKKFVVTNKPGKGEQYFRFYDPRVLKRYLPAITVQERTDFFGPVTAFDAEGDKPGTIIRFTQEAGQLQHTVIDISRPDAMTRI